MQMLTLKFTKMQGTGNDYVYVNCLSCNVINRPELARKVSDRHFGIGSDGLICIDRSDVADFKMDMYNADGSGAQMCGNGIRCVGKYVYDRGLTDKTELEIETGAGIKKLRLNLRGGKVESVRVCMGAPEFKPEKIPALADGADFINRPVKAAGKVWNVTALSVGNPHAVIFAKDVAGLDLEAIGPEFEFHRLFPERVNTEFVRVISRGELEMRVWERGAGETMACGTGATAALVAAALLELVGDEASVRLPGGSLKIEWDRKTNITYMTGPAVTVFCGELYLDDDNFCGASHI